MRVLAGAVLLAACGRVGFGSGGTTSGVDAADAPSVPFVEPIGRLDTTFGPTASGITITTLAAPSKVRPYQVAMRPGGGYLAIGTHETGASSRVGLFAYTADGLPDGSFGASGVADLDPPGTDAFAYAAGRVGTQIVVVGDSSDGGATSDDVTFGRISTDGTLDTSFGTAGFTRIDLRDQRKADTLNGMTAVGDDVIGCGAQAYDQADSHFALVRLDPTGAPAAGWGTGGVVLDDFGSGAKDECNGAVVANGRIIAVGYTGSGNLSVIAGYTAAGERDPTFATNGFATFGTDYSGLYGATIVDGDILAVGETDTGALAVRLSPDGARRTSFGTNGEAVYSQMDVLFAAVPQPNGKVIVVGERGTMAVVARIMPDGSLDPAFGTGGTALLASSTTTQGVLLEPGGRIVVVGVAGTGTQISGVIARFD